MGVYNIPDDGSSYEDVRDAISRITWFLKEFDTGARFLTSTLPRNEVDERNLLRMFPERAGNREGQLRLQELEEGFVPLIIPGTPLWKRATPKIGATRTAPFSDSASDALQKAAERMRVSPEVAIAVCVALRIQLQQMARQRGFRVYAIRDGIYNLIAFPG